MSSESGLRHLLRRLGAAFYDGILVIALLFAAGAILVMLANTMIPEAFAHGGKLAGLFTVLGFLVSVGVVTIEHALPH